MCGIVGYIGKDKALPIVLNGLKMLEYRGYDSAGVAFIKNKKIIISKEVGRIKSLEESLNLDEDTYVSIGHTRWATHGEPNKINSHPHKVGKFTVVHNGIIENHLEIKNNLIKKGYKFKTKTDTEVIPALLDYYYSKCNNILESIKKTIKDIIGSYALGILCDDDIESIYTTRLSSPLIIAKGENGNYIASDVPAILEYTNKYILLDDYNIAKINKHSINIYDRDLNEIKYKERIFDGSKEGILKNGYENYMLKEINEDKKAFLDTYKYYVENNQFKDTMPNFKKYKNIHIVACGSAYYVGLISANLIKEYVNIPVYTEVASEYRYAKNFYDKNTLVILISQSGETADTLASLKKAKEDGIDTLYIVNVVSSSIARESKYTLYTKAGPEIAVATTKAFVAQLTLMTLITIKLSNRLDLLKDFDISRKIDKVLKEDYMVYAKKIYNSSNTFFIGRSIDYGLCLEGSLKLKETSYINSVAFPSGELKHGTISLIENNTPVIGICTSDDIRLKLISNLKEVKARGAYVIYVTNEDIKDNFYDMIIKLPKVNSIVMPILTVIPLQLIAYYVAKLRKCDIDKPKNLAKSVTVE
jgi:glucosamine--fructose-6-phosphate aminotransferase (isomerizing)